MGQRRNRRAASCGTEEVSGARQAGKPSKPAADLPGADDAPNPPLVRPSGSSRLLPRARRGRRCIREHGWKARARIADLRAPFRFGAGLDSPRTQRSAEGCSASPVPSAKALLKLTPNGALRLGMIRYTVAGGREKAPSRASAWGQLPPEDSNLHQRFQSMSGCLTQRPRRIDDCSQGVAFPRLFRVPQVVYRTHTSVPLCTKISDQSLTSCSWAHPRQLHESGIQAGS